MRVSGVGWREQREIRGPQVRFLVGGALDRFDRTNRLSVATTGAATLTCLGFLASRLLRFWPFAMETPLHRSAVLEHKSRCAQTGGTPARHVAACMGTHAVSRPPMRRRQRVWWGRLRRSLAR